jgi:hypothetical protein
MAGLRLMLHRLLPDQTRKFRFCCFRVFRLGSRDSVTSKGKIMKSGTQTAVALAFGYVLGRRRKMRLALMLAAAAMTPGLGGVGGQLARKGTKALGSTDAFGKLSPELAEMTGLVRGDLADAGKAAAMTAVNSRVEDLTDWIHDRAEAWREAIPAGADTGELVAKEGPRRGARRRSEAAGPARDEEEAGPARDEEYDDEDREPSPPRERAGRRRTPARRSGESAGRSGAADRAGEPARTRRRPARPRAAASDSPVVRRRGRRS